MLISVQFNRFGHLTAKPVSDRIADFGAHLGYDASCIDPRRSLRNQGVL